MAGVAVTLRRAHPSDPSKPLMDFDIALMLLPFQLLGVAIGWARSDRALSCMRDSVTIEGVCWMSTLRREAGHDHGETVLSQTP